MATDALTNVSATVEIRISIKPVNDPPSVTMSGYNASASPQLAAISTTEDLCIDFSYDSNGCRCERNSGSTLTVVLNVSDKGKISFKSGKFATGVRLLASATSDAERNTE